MASTDSVVEGDLVEYLENTDMNLYVGERQEQARVYSSNATQNAISTRYYG